MTSAAVAVEEPRRRERLAVAAALVTVSLWASAFVGIRSAGRDLSPGALTLGRILVAALALGVLVAARREPWPVRRDLVPIAVYGVLWFGGYNLALNEAERRLDAGTAAMLVNVGPLLIAVLAALVLREGFPRRVALGCGIAFGGAALIGYATSENGFSAGWGALLCLAAAFLWASAVVIQKPLLTRISALQVTFLACCVGVLVTLPFAPTLVREAGDARSTALGWVVYLGIFPTAIGFVTWAYALARATAGRTGAMTYLVPPLAILFGWLLLGETPPWLAIPGGALCLTGVIVARRRPA